MGAFCKFALGSMDTPALSSGRGVSSSVGATAGDLTVRAAAGETGVSFSAAFGRLAGLAERHAPASADSAVSPLNWLANCAPLPASPSVEGRDAAMEGKDGTAECSAKAMFTRPRDADGVSSGSVDGATAGDLTVRAVAGETGVPFSAAFGRLAGLAERHAPASADSAVSPLNWLANCAPLPASPSVDGRDAAV
jgi:hypothetical protein